MPGSSPATTTTTSSAVAVGITILAIVAVDKEPRTALEHYLRDNEIAVRAALAAGAGSAIGDLAAFFAIREEDLPVFARLLRREREALSLHAFRTRDVDALMASGSLCDSSTSSTRPSAWRRRSTRRRSGGSSRRPSGKAAHRS